MRRHSLYVDVLVTLSGYRYHVKGHDNVHRRYAGFRLKFSSKARRAARLLAIYLVS